MKAGLIFDMMLTLLDILLRFSFQSWLKLLKFYLITIEPGRTWDSKCPKTRLSGFQTPQKSAFELAGFSDILYEEVLFIQRMVLARIFCLKTRLSNVRIADKSDFLKHSSVQHLYNGPVKVDYHGFQNTEKLFCFQTFGFQTQNIVSRNLHWDMFFDTIFCIKIPNKQKFGFHTFTALGNFHYLIVFFQIPPEFNLGFLLGLN